MGMGMGMEEPWRHVVSSIGRALGVRARACRGGLNVYRHVGTQSRRGGTISAWCGIMAPTLGASDL